MKKETIVTAKTVEEALELAAKELGANVADLEYTVLEEAKKGLFGFGAAPAKVQATYAPTAIDLALDFVKTTLKNMNIDAVVTVSDTELGKKIDVSGEDAGVLIGHHGETLDSFQHLANLAANRTENKKGGTPKISVDIESYRAKREETLRALARRMAHRVVKYKRSVMLEPMSAYERRIIHSEIQGIEGVSTNSVGSDNNRKIVIFLTDKKPKELFEEDAKKNEFKKEFESDDDVTNNVLETVEVSASTNPDGDYAAEDTEVVETIRPANEIVDEEIEQ